MGEPAVVVYVVKKWGNRWEMKWGDGVAGHYGSEWRGKAEDGENPGGEGGGAAVGGERKKMAKGQNGKRWEKGVADHYGLLGGEQKKGGEFM